MRTHLAPRVMNWLHTAALLAMMGVLSWGVAYFILGPRVTTVVVAISLASMVFRVWGARSVLRREMGARKLASNEIEHIQDLVAKLSRSAGLRRTPELWYSLDASPNAYALGTRRRSFIAISDGLLYALEPREIAGVIAHEVAHIAHGDLWILHGAQAMARALSGMMRLGTVLCLLMIPFVLADMISFAWEIPAAIFGYQAMMTGFVRAVSRVREFEADRGAAAITGDPEALISGLERMNEISPPRLRDRLWPFSLFNSHPSTVDRVTCLLRIKPSRANVPETVTQKVPEARPAQAKPGRPARSGQSKRRALKNPILGDCPF